MLLKLAFPGAQSVPIHASPSITVLGFAFGLSLLTGVLFGVAPAWIAAQTQPVDANSNRKNKADRESLDRSMLAWAMWAIPRQIPVIDRAQEGGGSRVLVQDRFGLYAWIAKLKIAKCFSV